jgi:hypothetical protein
MGPAALPQPSHAPGGKELQAAGKESIASNQVLAGYRYTDAGNSIVGFG